MTDSGEKSNVVRIGLHTMKTNRFFFHSVGILIAYAVLFMIMRQALFAQLISAIHNEPEIEREGLRSSRIKFPILLRHHDGEAIQDILEKEKTKKESLKASNTVFRAEVVPEKKTVGDKDKGSNDKLRYVRHVLQSFLHA